MAYSLSLRLYNHAARTKHTVPVTTTAGTISALFCPIVTVPKLAIVAVAALAVALPILLLRLASTEVAAALSDDVSVSLLILLLKLDAAELVAEPIDDVSVEY